MDTGKRLLSTFYSSWGSLVTIKESSEKIILCNGYSDSVKCEMFDGIKTVAIAETRVNHKHACMSVNEQGKSIIIAGSVSSSVEILEIRSKHKIIKKKSIIFSGWQNTQPHPAGKLHGHSCASIPNGIITVGGDVQNDNQHKAKNVYLFRNGQWSSAGQMQNVSKSSENHFLIILRATHTPQLSFTITSFWFSAENTRI